MTPHGGSVKKALQYIVSWKNEPQGPVDQTEMQLNPFGRPPRAVLGTNLGCFVRTAQCCLASH